MRSTRLVHGFPERDAAVIKQYAGLYYSNKVWETNWMARAERTLPFGGVVLRFKSSDREGSLDHFRLRSRAFPEEPKLGPKGDPMDWLYASLPDDKAPSHRLVLACCGTSH